MAVLTIAGLYPLILAIGASVGAVTDLPGPVTTLITVSGVASVATYWVMPLMTQVFRRWLF